MNFMILICVLTASASVSATTQEFVKLEPYSTTNHGTSGIGSYLYGGSVLQKSAQLASLARSSAINAKNAVYSQHSAGNQAEFGIKNSLANVAVEASKTAQAALTGKQALLSNIKHQIISTQNQLKEEILQYHQASSSSQAAQEAAHKSQAQLHSLRVALAEAEAAAHDSAAAAIEASNAEAAQKAMVFEAKQKLEILINQLKHVGGDLKDIEISVIKAAKAAQAASINANNTRYKTHIHYGYHI